MDPGECRTVPHVPDSERDSACPRGCAMCGLQCGRYSSKVGAVCGSSARTDLCGGCRVTGIPTATIKKTQLDFPHHLPPSESLSKSAVQLSSAPFSQPPKPLHSPSALWVPSGSLAWRCHQEFPVLFHEALQLSQLFFHSCQGIFCIPRLYLQVIRIVSNAR